VVERSETLVDSSVLLDVLTEDAAWGRRSREVLARAGDEERLIINPVIYAEISTRPPTRSAVHSCNGTYARGRVGIAGRAICAVWDAGRVQPLLRSTAYAPISRPRPPGGGIPVVRSQ